VEASSSWVSSPSLEAEEEELLTCPCPQHVQEVEKEVDSRLDPCQLQDSCCALPLQLVNAIVDRRVQAWRLVSAVVDHQLEEKVDVA
jgi:hypothetical protein